jgi:hypothetical protein
MALIAFWDESLFDDGVDGNIKTLRSLLDGVQVPSYCYEIPFPKSLDLKNPDSIMIVSNLENYRKSSSPAIYQSQFGTLKTESSATSASDSPLHEGLYKGGLGVFKIRNSKFANSKFICSFSFFLEQFESGLTGLQHNLHQDLLARQLPVDHH